MWAYLYRCNYYRDCRGGMGDVEMKREDIIKVFICDKCSKQNFCIFDGGCGPDLGVQLCPVGFKDTLWKYVSILKTRYNKLTLKDIISEDLIES